MAILSGVTPSESDKVRQSALADVITHAKFQDDIFRGYDFTGGRISHFPIHFCMGLTTVQRDCAACDSKSHTSFRLIPTSMTLNDLQRRNSPYFAFFHRIR